MPFYQLKGVWTTPKFYKSLGLRLINNQAIITTIQSSQKHFHPLNLESIRLIANMKFTAVILAIAVTASARAVPSSDEVVTALKARGFGFNGTLMLPISF